MYFELKKFFPKPDVVQTKDYNIYYIISMICTSACGMSAFLVALFYLTDNNKLIPTALVPISSVVLVHYFNERGKHFISALVLFLFTYIFSVCTTLYFGWQSGFQYYLIVQVAVFILYPYLDIKYLFSLSLLAVVSFLLLYLTMENTPSNNFQFNFILHSINSIFAIAVLCASNLFFRTNAQYLIDKFNHKASIDPLTGLMSRASMIQLFKEYGKNTNSKPQTAALLLFDVDNFKDINHKIGHQLGDKLLSQVAKIFKTGLNETYSISRWGGDEFLVFAPFTFTKDAAELAENLRLAVESHSFELENKTVNLTATCGVTTVRSKDEIESALAQADTLISQGKGNGRNQVCVFNSAITERF